MLTRQLQTLGVDRQTVDSLPDRLQNLLKALCARSLAYKSRRQKAQQNGSKNSGHSTRILARGLQSHRTALKKALDHCDRKH
jgi:hypothetical protein